jgi:hypothetical protein
MRTLPTTIHGGLLCLLMLFPATAANAVETVSNGITSYQTSNTISYSLPGWSTGWGSGNTNTGWNYVGQVNGASGVYLGNGWVLTAGHVGAGNFSLGGFTYNYSGFSYTSFTNGTNLADLNLFRINTTSTTGNVLSLQSLLLATNAPSAFSRFNTGTKVVMIGYGGGHGETWGINTVNAVDITVQLTGWPYTTVDYVTAYGVTSASSRSVTNTAVLVSGDSGGGNFMTNAAGSWMLCGLNEAVDGASNSYLVQISAYSSQINAVIAVPEAGTWSLALLGLSAILLALRQKRNGALG